VSDKPNILITGACGQVGSELTLALNEQYGAEHVILSDIREPQMEGLKNNPFELMDVRDPERLSTILQTHGIGQVYHMASILSAKGEQNPRMAWDINMNGLLNVLDAAVEFGVKKVFWPSSIAVFGPNSPKINTPQFTTMDPDTIYGISKLAGERWCHHYHFKHGLDIRSLRYPGLISYKAPAGGGTTDYAVDIYFKAVEEGRFECFLSEDTILPMMYMDDAIKATIDLMEAPSEQISVRSSYNVTAFSFAPREVAEEIKKYIPDFSVTYQPDFRQKIADTWPESIDDAFAKVE
jgi:nucleoside-diphosphate-sugar epimerase